MTDLEQMMGDMKKKYTIATSHFAESSSVEPETFFGYFNTFILQYMVFHHQFQFHFLRIFQHFYLAIHGISLPILVSLSSNISTLLSCNTWYFTTHFNCNFLGDFNSLFGNRWNSTFHSILNFTWYDLRYCNCHILILFRTLKIFW